MRSASWSAKGALKLYKKGELGNGKRYVSSGMYIISKKPAKSKNLHFCIKFRHYRIYFVSK
jgi:hypothetical protein